MSLLSGSGSDSRPSNVSSCLTYHRSRFEEEIKQAEECKKRGDDINAGFIIRLLVC